MRGREYWNGCRYLSDPRAASRGHYESWFQRANHPARPLAFWIRYTIFSPKDRARDTVGEIWAVYFDGEKQEIVAMVEPVPINKCHFSAHALQHRIGEAILGSEKIQGCASGQGQQMSWNLRYRSPDPYLLLLPERLYDAPFPKAKSMVGSPLARFSGTLDVNGSLVKIEDWVGSQNHNWGLKHTDHYAWGQVCGFDGDSESFLEVATARVKLGPLSTPWLTLMVLRVDGEEYRLNSLPQSVRAHGHYEYFSWEFESKTKMASICGAIFAPRDSFVGLPYGNPPGGQKTCLNSKLARCEIRVRRPGQPERLLVSERRTAFEILTDDHNHGVPVLRARHMQY